MFTDSTVTQALNTYSPLELSVKSRVLLVVAVSPSGLNHTMEGVAIKFSTTYAVAVTAETRPHRSTLLTELMDTEGGGAAGKKKKTFIKQ